MRADVPLGHEALLVDAFEVPLDVTDDASAAAAAQLIEDRGGLAVVPLVDAPRVTTVIAWLPQSTSPHPRRPGARTATRL